ncbi:Cof-type HAD-IIB family hydrolase [Cellulomonas sp. HZM]|uniref:Cof-type HAD-IIB family hydrolase n=1 Tax=Cellulomonas sp. HZM TaxID=1454010 RepID=UPI000493960C
MEGVIAPTFDPLPDLRLVAIDMDGTLLDDDKRLDPSFWPLLDELHDRGVVVCPASGRQYATLRAQFDRDDLVYIAENGAYVVHEGREVSSRTIDRATANDVVRAVRAAGRDTGTVLCGKRSAYVERTDEAFLEQVRPYYRLLELVDDLTDVRDDDVLKVAVYDFASSQELTDAVLGRFDGPQRVVVSGEHWVDVMDPEVDKGLALRAVQDVLGVTREQTMAFGDYHNDLGMLEAAGWSVAMDNAHPDVRAVARVVAPTNNDNGVVRTLRAALGL